MYDITDAHSAGALYTGRLSNFLDNLGHGVFTPRKYVVVGNLESSSRRPSRYKRRKAGRLPVKVTSLDYQATDTEFTLCGEIDSSLCAFSTVNHASSKVRPLLIQDAEGRETLIDATSFDTLLGKTSGVRRLPTVSKYIDWECVRLGRYMSLNKKRLERFNLRQEKLRVTFEDKRKGRILKLNRLKEWFEYLTGKYGPKFDAPLRDVVEKIRSASERKWVERDFVPRPYVFKYYNFLTATAVRPVVAPQSPDFTIPLPVHHARYSWKKSFGDVSYRLRYVRSQHVPFDMLREERLVVQQPVAISRYPLSFRPDYHPDAYAGDRFEAPDYDEAKLFAAIQSCIPDAKMAVNVPVAIFELKELGGSLKRFKEAYRALARLWQSDSVWSTLRKQLGVSRSGIVAATQYLSGLDLEHKFGDLQSFNDAFTALKEVLEHLGGGHSVLKRMLEDRCKEKAYHRQFDEKLVSQEWEESLADFLIAQENHTLELPSRVTDMYGERDATERDAQCLRHARHALIRECLGHVKVQCRRTISSVYRMTSLCSFEIFDELGRPMTDDAIATRVLMDRLGLNVAPRSLWEIIPFSFVVDWMFDISALLDTLTIKNVRAEATLHQVVVSRRQLVQNAVTIRDLEWSEDGSINPDWWDGESVGSYRREASVDGTSLEFLSRSYDRWVLDTDTIIRAGKIPLLKRPSWLQMLTGAELLIGNQ